MYNSYYGNFRTKTFNDIFPSAQVFSTLYNNGMFPSTTLDSSSLQTLYYLLVGKYGNSHISNSDENQFKVELLGIIFKFGGAWKKRLTIQNALQSMTDAQMVAGMEQLSNNASNPGEIPASSSDILNTDGTLKYVNSQNQIKTKRSLLDGYANLIALLKSDVTSEFIDRFKDLFLVIVVPEEPLWYGTEEEEES